MLRPQLERIIELLMWSTDVAGGSENPDSLDWKLEFNPLWTPDDATKAKTTLTDAQTAQIMTGIGAMSTDDALDFVKGQSNNNVAVGSNKEQQKPNDAQLASQIEKKLKETENNGNESS